jgi:cytochrome c-type biogenesis protein
MLVTDSLNLIATWTLQNNLYLDLSFGGGGVPSYFTAVIAGFLSFLSPCVLPLVPAYLGYLSGHALASARVE